MASDGFADIVVVGFGVAGAAAALSAATRGASVVVLDRGAPPSVGLRAAAVAAGVDFRAQCRVHELTVIGGRVAGVGFASLRAGSVAATGHRVLDRIRRRMPLSLAPLVSRAADRLWDSRFDVSQISCAAVILALDSHHWEFVASALDASSSMRVRHDSLSPMPAPAIAEIRHGGRRQPVCSECFSVCGMQFRVDSGTGTVANVAGSSVIGLYSAVSADPGASDRGAVGGRRAAHSAARSVERVERASFRPLV